ncbi:MAG TPA: formate dehydrogenase subunit gamma [Steroidobacteraceae bacterium]|jgi:formate dehydrogenase subunit gamma
MTSSAAARNELDPAIREQVDRALAQYQGRQGALLQILHAVQASVGYIPAQSLPVIAESLNLSRADVHGVVSFYHYFRREPAGRHTIQLCQAEACRSMHCEVLADHVRTRLGIDFHHTTSDGRFSLEPVYCLGNCACAPSLMFDDELHGRVTADSFDALIDEKAGSP